MGNEPQRDRMSTYAVDGRASDNLLQKGCKWSLPSPNASFWRYAGKLIIIIIIIIPFLHEVINHVNSQYRLNFPTGWTESRPMVVEQHQSGKETLCPWNCIQLLPLLHDSVFRPTFQRLAMYTHNGQHIPAEDKPPTREIAGRDYLSCIQAFPQLHGKSVNGIVGLRWDGLRGRLTKARASNNARKGRGLRTTSINSSP